MHPWACRARLVTAQQAFTGGVAAFRDGDTVRVADLLEVSLLLQLYPYPHSPELDAWHRALASSAAAFMPRKLRLARTLLMLGQAHAVYGDAYADVTTLDSAYIAARAAAALLAPLLEFDPSGKFSEWPSTEVLAAEMEEVQQLLQGLPHRGRVALDVASTEKVAQGLGASHVMLLCRVGLD